MDIEVEEVFEEEGQASFFSLARKVVLAGVGAVALAQDEAEMFVKKLVERGEIAEKDGRTLLRDVMEKGKVQPKKRVRAMSNGMDAQVEKVLHRLNVPSKRDIEALSAKVVALTEKIDQMAS